MKKLIMFFIPVFGTSAADLERQKSMRQLYSIVDR